MPTAKAVSSTNLRKRRVNSEAFYVVGAGADGLRCVIAVDKLEKAKAALGQ